MFNFMSFTTDVIGSVRNWGQSVGPRPATFGQDLELFTYLYILYKLMFEFLKILIRTCNFFSLVLNTGDWVNKTMGMT